MKSIEKNTHYISAGNLFSKNIFVQKYLNENKGPVLNVYSDESILNHSIKISHFLDIHQKPIQNLNDFIDFSLNNIGIF